MRPLRTTCPYCGVGCGLIVERGEQGEPPGAAPDRRLRRPGDWTVRGDPDHASNFGRLCSKGAALTDTLDLEGRLLYPEVRGRRVSWDAALDAVAHGFDDAVARHGRDAVAFYVSGQMLTEDYYVANKLMKGFIGSANIDTNSRLCMASAVAGYRRAFGTDTVPNSYADLEQAQLLVIVGANMAWCHPVLFQRIAQAKRANPAVRVVVIDPRRTATCDIADLFLPIRPGTDAALFNGLLSYVGRENVLDLGFLEAHTDGIEAALQAARDGTDSIADVARVCGLADAAVATFYRWFATTPRTLTLFSQGVNQSSSGTDKVNSIVNVHLATGRIGKPGAGPFSLTGQSNAMGGREVGGLANQLAAHMDFAPEHVARVARFWRAPAVAQRPGLKAVELFGAIAAGRIKAVWIICTNPVVSMPEADVVERALRRCELVVVSDCMRDTDTTACADILLPAAAWGEKSGTVTSSERRISRQRAFVEAPGESRPDWWIVTEVARRMGFGGSFPYRSPADIFREHARLSGYENGGSRAFDIGALAALSDDEYEALAPVQWPMPAGATEGGGRPRPVFAGGRFFTASGRASLIPIRPRPPQTLPDARYPFILNTGRIRDQWHTMTRTGTSARLSGHRPEPFVQISPRDARRLEVATGDFAELSHGHSRMLARVEVTGDLQLGQVFVPMHWSARFARHARAGALIDATTDPVSGQPEFKHAAVALRRYRPAWRGFILSRGPLERAFDWRECSYLVRGKGVGYWRYDIAGDAPPASWPEWARCAMGAGGEWIELSDASAGRYRAAVLADRRLDACIFIARGGALPDRGWLATLFERDVATLDRSARLSLLAGRAPDGAPAAGPLICSCFSVRRDALLAAIVKQGLSTTEQIGRSLSAGTRCGSCVPEIEAMLKRGG